jgi:hypothetical protein
MKIAILKGPKGLSTKIPRPYQQDETRKELERRYKEDNLKLVKLIKLRPSEEILNMQIVSIHLHCRDNQLFEGFDSLLTAAFKAGLHIGRKKTSRR